MAWADSNPDPDRAGDSDPVEDFTLLYSQLELSDLEFEFVTGGVGRGQFAGWVARIRELAVAEGIIVDE